MKSGLREEEAHEVVQETVITVAKNIHKPPPITNSRIGALVQRMESRERTASHSPGTASTIWNGVASTVVR